MPVKHHKAKRAKPLDAPSVGLKGLVKSGDELAFRDFMSDIFAAAAALQMLRRKAAKSFGLSSSELAVIMAVAKLKPDPSIRRIAAHLHVSASNVTADVGRLVRAKLLKKSQDSDDARAINVALTLSGRALVDDMVPTLRAVNDRLFVGMSRSDMTAVGKLLKHIISEGDRLVRVKSQSVG